MKKDVEIESVKEFIGYIINPDYPLDYDNCIEESIDVIKQFKEFTSTKTNSRNFANKHNFCLQNSSIIYDFLWYLNNEHNDLSEKTHLYYRGHSNKDYDLAPGIYRPNTKSENYFFREMQVRCAMHLSQETLLDKLVYLQHYECPTRLLDITSNPLVALYFACGGDSQTNGAVYCFHIKDKDLLYPNSDRAQMLSHLCEFNEDEQNQIMAYAMLSIKYFPRYARKEKYIYSIIEKLYHAITRETPAFAREMLPFDLLRPAFIQVAKNNPRIIKQDGAFIISGLSVDGKDCSKRIEKYVFQRIIIPGNLKQQILKELDSIGICEATLFPEVDKVASYLRKQ